jgi:putative aldouronate transport system substrate-binding protein
MKKICLFAGVCFFISAALYGAGGGQSAVSGASGSETLNIVIRNIGSAVSDDNDIIRELERRTGLKIHFELKPGDNYYQAITTIIASGDYPDAMEYNGGTFPVDLQNLADDKVIRPLDDLLAKHGPHFTPDVRPDYLWFVSVSDGKRYAIPDRVFDYGSNNAIVIRKDFMRKLGLSIPRNSDEFFNVLTAFEKNKDQLVGPGKRFIPLGASTVNNCWEYFMEFLKSENGIISGWNPVNGKIINEVNMPNYKNVIQTMRKFYQAGLMEPEYPIISTRNEYFKRAGELQYGAMCWWCDAVDRAISTTAAEVFDAAPVLEGNLEFIPYFNDKSGVH